MNTNVHEPINSNGKLDSHRAVERTAEGGWRIAGTRVSLDSVVHAHRFGHSLDEIATEFPALTSEQIRGVIEFYLSRQSEIDEYLKEQELRWNQLRESSQARQDPLLDRLRSQAATGS